MFCVSFFKLVLMVTGVFLAGMGYQCFRSNWRSWVARLREKTGDS